MTPPPRIKKTAKILPPRKLTEESRRVEVEIERENPDDEPISAHAKTSLNSFDKDMALAEALERAEHDPDAPPVESVSAIVNILGSIVRAINEGRSIEKYKDDILRTVARQTEKADVLNGFVNAINQERLADALYVQAKLEKKFKRAVHTKLTQTEAIELWKVSCDIYRDIRTDMIKNSKPVDSNAAIEKLTEAKKEQNIIDWEGTTPQGREIIRKRLYAMEKEVEKYAK